jgi:hypothetical protein
MSQVRSRMQLEPSERRDDHTSICRPKVNPTALFTVQFLPQLPTQLSSEGDHAPPP